jgi:hypothetical protein
METWSAKDAERRLVELAENLSAPAPEECVLCYVERMVDSFGCDNTLRWARHWRDLRQPRATGLERRLESRGGFCDCEIFLNGWTLDEDLAVRVDDGEPAAVQPRRPCAGVGPRSSQPCANWLPWRRSRW